MTETAIIERADLEAHRLIRDTEAAHLLAIGRSRIGAGLCWHCRMGAEPVSVADKLPFVGWHCSKHQPG